MACGFSARQPQDQNTGLLQRGENCRFRSLSPTPPRINRLVVAKRPAGPLRFWRVSALRGMIVGYAGASADDRSPDSRTDVLSTARAGKVFADRATDRDACGRIGGKSARGRPVLWSAETAGISGLLRAFGLRRGEIADKVIADEIKKHSRVNASTGERGHGQILTFAGGSQGFKIVLAKSILIFALGFSQSSCRCRMRFKAVWDGSKLRARLVVFVDRIAIGAVHL